MNASLNINRYKPLNIAIELGDIGLIKYLIKGKHAYIYSIANNKLTFIAQAIRDLSEEKAEEVVLYLIEQRADLTVANNSGNRALEIAIKKGYAKIAKIIEGAMQKQNIPIEK